MNIFLIGFMGSGKSHWGKQWARQLGFTFVELDALIEAEAGKSIAQIFATEGEGVFREMESRLLKTCTSADCIVATGGGTPCFFDNMNWMNAHGTTVYLQATPQLLTQRLVGEKEQRPLLHDVADTELEAFIAAKLAERAPFYQQAKAVLNAGALTDNSLLPYC